MNSFEIALDATQKNSFDLMAVRALQVCDAADDLLAALESMVAKIDADKLPISCSIARAAIAKAKGE